MPRDWAITVFYTTSSPVEDDELWEHMSSLLPRAMLPRAMLPRRIERLARLPRLPNGKVDRARCQARSA